MINFLHSRNILLESLLIFYFLKFTHFEWLAYSALDCNLCNTAFRALKVELLTPSLSKEKKSKTLNKFTRFCGKTKTTNEQNYLHFNTFLHFWIRRHTECHSSSRAVTHTKYYVHRFS